MAPQRNFRELIEGRWTYSRLVCVGLDSDFDQLPQHLRDSPAGPRVNTVRFNREIIDATADVACAFKLNVAFYGKSGLDGIAALQETIDYVHAAYPRIPVILDAKVGDVGATNDAYAEWAFDWLSADALTVSPYLGSEAMVPFLKREDKGIFVLCRTSNLGAGEFQNLIVSSTGENLYEHVARMVATSWNANGNCGLVVGAAHPAELSIVRDIVGDDMPILVPGVGRQGGDVPRIVAAGMNVRGNGLIINSSSEVIFAADDNEFAGAALIAATVLDHQVTETLKHLAGRKIV